MQRYKGILKEFSPNSQSLGVVKVLGPFGPWVDQQLPVRSVKNDTVLIDGIVVDFIIVEQPKDGYLAIDLQPSEVAHPLGSTGNRSPSVPEIITRVQDEAEEASKQEVAKHTNYLDSIVEEIRVELEESALETGGLEVNGKKGRGGPRHKLLQSLVAKIGESCGWDVEIERGIHDGMFVDVELRKGDVKIAVEIPMTNAPRETNNLKKCIDAGYQYIISLNTNRRVLGSVRKSASKRLGEDVVNRCVTSMVPDSLKSFLEAVDVPTPGVKRIRGYRVKTRFISLSVEARAARREVIASVLLRAKTQEQGEKPPAPA